MGDIEMPFATRRLFMWHLSQKALAHNVLPEAYPLIDMSVFGAVVIAHLQAGAEVIQHHCLMVSKITFNICDYD